MGFLTVKEVADKLKVTPYTVREWLKTGKLKGSKPGGPDGGWRVSEKDLLNLLKNEGKAS